MRTVHRVKIAALVASAALTMLGCNDPIEPVVLPPPVPGDEQRLLIGQGHSPAWSPDGSRIAFVH